MSNPDVLDRLFAELATADMPVPAPAKVVARGRQRRRRARGRALTAVAAVAVIAIGVTQLPRVRATPATVSQQHGVCAAAPDAALNAELRHALPVSRQQSVSVLAVSPNGALLYLMTTTAGFHGVAAESVATGAISQKLTLEGMPPNFNGVQGGLGPNGEVVFRVAVARYDPDGELMLGTVLVFSPRTIPWSSIGKSAALGPPGTHEEALSAPVFAGPDHQLVAWESSGPAAEGINVTTRQIVETNLLTGVTDVVASGYLGAPAFVGDALVWPAASSATGPYHLVAASASTFPARQRVAVPVALRKAGAAALLVSSGGAIAYASPDRTRVFYSPSLTQPARQVLRLPVGSQLSPGGLISGGIMPSGLAVGPGYLAWNTSAGASYVASAKTLAATRITDATGTWGAVQGLGSYIFASRSARPTSEVRSYYLLSGSVVHGLTCARHGG
jgi:hypothetical protein